MSEDHGSRQNGVRHANGHPALGGKGTDLRPGGAPTEPPARQPAFNLPPVIIAFALVLAAVHLGRTVLLSPEADLAVILRFAFIPAIYGNDASALPVAAARWWMPFSYTLLHGDWLHLGMNLLWMAVFGSPVARRFGAIPFFALTLLASAGGALAHYLYFPGAFVPMIGASGAVSGYVGAASRFVFTPGGFRGGASFRHDGPAQTLAASFANRNFLSFVGVWFVLNILSGSGILQMPGQSDAGIAWQAHIGGFLAGLLGFGLFERLRNRP
ncbi:MAG: rhomboid family intramembrane serine protease [Nitratireductor sp.]|nr:rhomboid family intramembrane serine protease [Nitratireductor sp.]